MLVVFFDIDGTLLTTGGAGGTAMRRALTRQFGVEHPADVPFSGRTDRGIGAAFFAAHGIEDTDTHWQLFRRAYVEELKRQLPHHQGSVLPGIPALVSRLRRQSNVAIGLLTGNVRSGAELKLDYYGLGGHFAFGGFGDVHHHRDRVAHDALAEAKQRTNGSLTRAVVIGDTPLDVSCARAVGADVIAVATGIHSRDELAASQPDLLLDDLSDLSRVWEFLTRAAPARPEAGGRRL